ncbi:MAG TPA: DUF4278 domain-containing protein [Crinalium sp.]|jgi:hypothetical protein
MDFFIPLINTMALAAILIAFVVGLLLAPWQILLLLLILGLAGIEWLKNLQPSRSSHPIKPPSDGDQTVTAQPSPSTLQKTQQKIRDTVLVYRGASYKQPSVIDETELVEISGKYRGQIWKLSNLR